MARKASDLDQAETELIGAVRGRGTPNFSLTITCDKGRWVVTSLDLNRPFAAPEVGVGDSFSEAWLGRRAARPPES